jgi:hypothetical protein
VFVGYFGDSQQIPVSGHQGILIHSLLHNREIGGVGKSFAALLCWLHAMLEHSLAE